jgi:hypothetical protein
MEFPLLCRVLDELMGTLELDYLDGSSGELAGNRALAIRLE